MDSMDELLDVLLSGGVKFEFRLYSTGTEQRIPADGRPHKGEVVITWPRFDTISDPGTRGIVADAHHQCLNDRYRLRLEWTFFRRHIAACRQRIDDQVSEIERCRAELETHRDYLVEADADAVGMLARLEEDCRD